MLCKPWPSPSGVHLGVKRMYGSIGHYWRGMYNDVTKYVRRCAACFEEEKLSRPPGLNIASLPDQAAAEDRRQRRAEAIEAAKMETEPPASVVPGTRTKAQVMADRATRVWKKVSRGFGWFCEGFA